ncbi:MAG: fatty acid metabolism regulator protein [Candidatus Sericytochromatia bacterium]|nr:MAG: fatty acid metabolism regulator protein [Candidatus Sericytochromatia bacterium]GIX41200.1 MAG: fatty acid metabolism regulator protein [Leptospiraceae bacterium]
MSFNWSEVLPVERIMDATLIEKNIIKKIIDGQYKNVLPSERELSNEFKVTRQKIREILQRLQQDGWIEIQHGKPTRIKFIYEEGGLNILNSLIRHNILELPNITKEEFIIKLLEIRYALAPVYTESCLKINSSVIKEYLKYGLEKQNLNKLKCSSKDITNFDWHLHRILCKYSENILFLFLLNSFKEIYFYFGIQYFSLEEARKRSIEFYKKFYKYIQEENCEKAVLEMKKVTKDSINILKKALSNHKKTN